MVWMFEDMFWFLVKTLNIVTKYVPHKQTASKRSALDISSHHTFIRKYSAVGYCNNLKQFSNSERLAYMYLE